MQIVTVNYRKHVKIKSTSISSDKSLQGKYLNWYNFSSQESRTLRPQVQLICSKVQLFLSKGQLHVPGDNY